MQRFLPLVIYAKWRLFAGRPPEAISENFYFVLETVLPGGSTQHGCRACAGRRTRTEEETTRGGIAAEPRRAERWRIPGTLYQLQRRDAAVKWRQRERDRRER